MFVTRIVQTLQMTYLGKVQS